MPRLPQTLIVLLIVGVGLASCKSGPDAAETAAEEENRYQMGPALDDSTYALVIESEYGGDTLTTAAFQAYILTFMQQAGRIMDESQRRRLRRGIAEEYIRRHLLEGEAQRLGLEADSARVEDQINQIAAQNRMTRAAFEDVLRDQGMTIDSLRALIEEQMPVQQLQQQMLEAATEPTPQELDAFRQEQSQQVRAQHILFQVPDPAQKAAVLAKAEAVLDSVKAGADFASLARRHSEGPSSVQGGDLGYFSRRDMVASFSEAAFALSDSGDVAGELVETQFGYHIIRLLGRRRGVLIDSVEARSQLMRERQQSAFEEEYGRLRERAVIRINPAIVDVDLNANNQG